MSEQRGTPGVIAEGTRLGSQVEQWLDARSRVEPERPVRWLPGWRRRSVVPVRGVGHLAVLVSLLRTGKFGGVEPAGDDTGRWCQTMCVGEEWIVEVHDGTPEDCALRVFRGGPGDYPCGSTDPPVHPIEKWSSMAAAEVMWAWLHGSLPEGCARTLRYCRDG